ncbi:MAG: hypothetical protein Aurels2KO_58260 [Aureliella sp.]
MGLRAGVHYGAGHFDHWMTQCCRQQRLEKGQVVEVWLCNVIEGWYRQIEIILESTGSSSAKRSGCDEKVVYDREHK